MTLTLRAERGGKPIGKPTVLKQKPADAPGGLRAWAAGVLGATRPATSAPDPKAEAGQLTTRAGEFRRLGNWAEAAGLIEAGLLLDPDQTDLHADAMFVLQKYTDQEWRFADRDAERVGRAVRAHRRGLDHLEALVARGADITRYQHPEGGELTWSFLRFYNRRLEPFPKAPAACRALIEGAQREQRETLLRIIPAVARQGRGGERTLIQAAVAYLPPAEKYELLEKVIVQLQDLPNPVARTVRYCYLGSTSLWGFRGPEFDQFLGRLAASPDTNLRAAGLRLKKDLAAALTAPPWSMKRLPPPDPAAPRFVTFKPIVLAAPADGEPELHTKLVALVAAGPGVDVLATFGGLYVMKEKGKPRRVWGEKTGFGAGLLALSFDGRYVWAASGDCLGRNPRLLVVDPIAEKVWAVTGRHGLPERAPEEGWDPPRPVETPCRPTRPRPGVPGGVTVRPGLGWGRDVHPRDGAGGEDRPRSPGGGGPDGRRGG